MAFALAVAAGLIAGLAFDLFVLSVVAAVLFFVAFFVALGHGLLVALAHAASLSAVLQIGYLSGVMGRGLGASRRWPGWTSSVVGRIVSSLGKGRIR